MTKFIEISNKDIYDKVNELIDANNRQHIKIINHQIKTNGKVKLNWWIATTALSLIFIVLGFLVHYMIGI